MLLLLPVELRQLCLDFLEDDTDALKELRLVNHSVGKLATLVLFRTAVLNPTEDSAELFAALIRSKYRQDVRCVVINDFNFDAEDCQEELEVTETYSEALSSLSRLVNLQELRLKFSEDCAAEPDAWINDGSVEKEVNQTIGYRSAILSIIFKAVEHLNALKVLSIRDLQDHMDRQLLESEAFKTIRSRLTGLHLQITTEESEQHALSHAAIHRGFTIDLPEIWLRPVLPHLTHLTLYSYTCMWGLYPFVDFRKVGTFPCLESLSLGNWTIAHDWQISWILSHGSTLKQLLLEDCPIILTLRMSSNDEMVRLNFPDLGAEDADSWGDCFKSVTLRWHEVLNRFRCDLSHLEHFALRCSDDRRGVEWFDDNFDHRYNITNMLRPTRYHFYNCGSVPCWLDPGPAEKAYLSYCKRRQPSPGKYEVKFPDCDEEDATALQKLIEVVYERSRIVV